ncbi:MAG TPA: 1-deoxy-D-xylulose-5-phosphate reductoisomerase [Bacteroidota bacterium]|nr:1-deoxy-D-xylulose-5-phosphate reductoisomerase [Bacteroidota bacterium]
MTSPRSIAILGSTGSIGRSSLEVIAAFPDRFRAAYLCAHRNIDLLREQINRFRPRGAVVLDGERADALRRTAAPGTEILAGIEGLLEIVGRDDVGLVLSALVGFAGLRPTLRALEAGKDVALANKETLVVGGELVMTAARKARVRLLPVDSEHSAIFQCLRGEEPRTVARLVLTASGGPFLTLPRERFSTVTVAEALNHPTWRMGAKITIDSATLMNKGLEVIEARWLFGVPQDRIRVLVHPQSIVHSLVEYVDGAVMAQLGMPDMKGPIAYALSYPERLPDVSPRLDLASLGALTFEEPDLDRFPCLAYAFDALRAGGSMPAVLSAANEVAVRHFSKERIRYGDIGRVIREVMDAHQPGPLKTVEDALKADLWARQEAERIIANRKV